MKRFLPVFLFLTGQSLIAQSFFTTSQNADLMVSGLDFNNAGGPLQFNHPNGIATDGQRFLLCDRFNNRILVWNSIPESWNDQPDLVLGQPDFFSNNPGAGKNNLNWTGNASIGAGGKIAAADTENDRILLWNSFPVQNGQSADISLYLPVFSAPGASEHYGWPWGVWTDGDRVAAVATSGGALLFWNHWPQADNTPPDYTVKLADFGTPRNISTDGSSYFFVGDHNARVHNGPGTFFWNSYPTLSDQPYDFYRDEWIKGAKTADGKLIAGGITSIYIWDSVPVDDTQDPDLTLTPTMYKNGDGVDVALAGNRVFVNNYNGNNVLVFNNLPQTNTQQPDYAVGSPAAATQTLDSIFYIQNPVLVTDGQRLIASSDFDRVLYIWDAFPDHSGQPYDRRIPAPPNAPLWAAALYDGALVTGARNIVSIWNASNLDAGPSATFINQIGTAQLNDVTGVALDGHHLYVATRSGKLYVWQGIPQNSSQNPLLTLSSSNGGQFSHLYSDGEYLCAARPEPPTGVDIYRVSDLANGVNTPNKVISSGMQRLNQVSQAVTYNGALAIASRADNAVILWKTPGDWGKVEKAVVLGQETNAGFESAIGRNRLFMPNSLLPLENQLWVGEFKFSSRILKFSYGATPVLEPFGQLIQATVYPNPAVEQVTVKFLPVADDQITIDLFDGSGRLMERLYSGMVETGVLFNQSFVLASADTSVQFLRISGKKQRIVLPVQR